MTWYYLREAHIHRNQFHTFREQRGAITLHPWETIGQKIRDAEARHAKTFPYLDPLRRAGKMWVAWELPEKLLQARARAHAASRVPDLVYFMTDEAHRHMAQTVFDTRNAFVFNDHQEA